MARWLALLSFVLALGLLATGCGGDDNEGGGGAAKKQPAETTGAEAGGKTVEVDQKDIQFKPAQITVKRGSTIVWKNEDSVNHDVHKTSGPGPDFKSGAAGNMNPGDSYKQKVTTPGTIKYVCEVHKPGMAGTIVVK
jgi:plastocyanin